MQHAVNDLAIAATKGTKQTMAELIHFLNYCATNSDASIIFYHSDMILVLALVSDIATHPTSTHQKQEVELKATIIWVTTMENCSTVQYMY